MFGKIPLPTPIPGPIAEIDVAISVSSASVGAVADNAWAGFTSPAGTVSSNSYWTPAPTKYLAATVDPLSFVARSVNSVRDQEIDTWARKGTVLMRFGSGQAIYFTHEGETTNGTLTIGVVTNYVEGSPAAATYAPLYANSDMVGTVSGYNKTDTTDDYFTFGVSGLAIYAKFNGVEFARVYDFRVLTAGEIALQATVAYGFRDVAVRLLMNAAIYSDTIHRIFDLRDVGLRALSVLGSISSGSNQLVLASNPGFVVGDSVIVELGGEPGAGLRGTVGVGGTWPAKSYSNVGAMNADTGQVTNLYAWVTDSGDVYRWSGSAWAAVAATQYYTKKAIPKALVATIIGISGLTLTLSSNASATATNATVHLDNYPILNTMFGTQGAALNALTPPDVRVMVPTGEFAISQTVTILARTGWRIEGSDNTKSVFFSPRGVPSAQIMPVSCIRSALIDLGLRGNARDNGFGLSVTETDIPSGSAYPYGFLFTSCERCLALNLKITDVFQDAVGAQYGVNVWAYNCSCSMTDGLRQYIQWMFQWSDSTGGGFVDCRVTSPNLIPGFEAFRSSGTSIIRPVGVNAAVSVNSSGGWLLDSPDLIINANSQSQDSPSPAFSSGNPIININSNIQPPSPDIELGGTIRNPRIRHVGFINSSNDVLQGIAVGAQTPNVTILGTYQAYPGAAGLLEFPNWQFPSTGFGALGVNSNGQNTVVNGMRITGTAGNGYTNVYLAGAGSSCINCVVDTITAPTQSGNMTNSEWNALHP